MKLHIFNPEHDIALASGLSNFTAPHAGRQLRHDLCWLPAFWASAADCVLVDDADHAQRSYRHFVKTNHLHSQWKGTFVTLQSLPHPTPSAIEPWGWDSALFASLHRAGIDSALMPDKKGVDAIRQLSHRRLSLQLLSLLCQEQGTTGLQYECTSTAEVSDLLDRHRRIVLKAPWSSSGRGLRFVDGDRSSLSMLSGWIRNLLVSQGCIMVEPFYNKVADFAMEFTAKKDGSVVFLGLSLFHTKNGAYTGNLLATEQAKRQRLCRYLPQHLLDSVAQLICTQTSRLFAGRYAGPFGVDMMVVHDPAGNTDTLLLHPCVELNLRRTMGHVALTLTPIVNPSEDDEVLRVMRIDYAESYQLKLDRL